MNPESLAKEAAILACLPGTSKYICDKCQLPQATVSKLLAKLILRNRAYQSGWLKPPGGMASQVYTAGPKPEGFTLPERPGKARKSSVKAATCTPPHTTPKQLGAPAAPHSLRMWDQENSTDHLFNHETEPVTIPPHMALFMMYGEQYVTPKRVDEWQTTPIISTHQPKAQT